MVPPIPIEHRKEIVKLRDAGYSFRNIRDVLMQKGAKYSVIGIGNCYQKIVKNGSIDAQPKQKYSKDMLERIKQELQAILEENSDLTGQQQIDEIKRRLGVTVSMDAVGRYRRMLGWKVMPIATNKLKNNSSLMPSSSSTSSGSSNFNNSSDIKSFKAEDGNNDDAAESHLKNNNNHHNLQQQSQATTTSRTSGYYLHPPDIALPPASLELNLPDVVTPTSETGLRLSTATSTTVAPINIQSVSGIVQVKNEFENNGNTTVLVPTPISTTLSTNTAAILPHLQQHQQIQLVPAQISTPSTSNSTANVSTQQQQLTNNTAIVYPLKTPLAKYGPMHVFTSRSIIKTGISASSLKYQVWAGISYQGATSICIWDANCRMRSTFYCSTILEKFFLPFRSERYANKRCILVQSNDTIYRSMETKMFMEHHGMEYTTWTNGRYGDENNPIELIWDEINDHIRSEIKPQCMDTLREAICNFWATKMTDSKCRQCLKKCSLFSEY